MHKRIMIILSLIIFLFVSTSNVYADWPMAGHDVKRTSFAPEDNITAGNKASWHVKFDDYIPSKAHIITVDRGSNSMVYVPTSRGVYALNPDSGTKLWQYKTAMPVGHSPTVVNDVMYIPSLDKTIHAVNAINGSRIWQSDRAGAGFYTSPLVINGKVYAGSRDGYFYALNASNGSLSWYYNVGAPINFSAAYDNGVVYFAANDSRAYALNASNGSLVWKSEKFPGDGFLVYWPVIHQGLVLLSRSHNYPATMTLTLIRHQFEGTVDGQPLLFDTSAISGISEIDAARFRRWNELDRDRDTFIVLSQSSGKRSQTSPILWWTNSADNRYPPAIGPNGRVWIPTPWHNASAFGAGRYAGWQPGTTKFKPIPAASTGYESADEPVAYAIFGGAIYQNAGGDGSDSGGIESLSGGGRGGWHHHKFSSAFGNYWSSTWPDFRYGNGFMLNTSDMWRSSLGHHGYQNPPVPLNGKVYFHRSNTVFCMKQ
jgi:outer membrane protein assembly factor BamB